MAKLRVALVNQYRGYEKGLLFRILLSLPAVEIELTEPTDADLIIIGPYPPQVPRASLWSRLVRRGMALTGIPHEKPRSHRRPITLYHTWENTRHDSIAADYSLSSDLSVTEASHCRFPAWMGSLEWTHEGIAPGPVPRLGDPIPVDELCEPLGDNSARARKSLIITSHFRQPRRVLIEAVRTLMEVDGYGPAFDRSIENHDASSFDKRDISRPYRFALCPENSMYPGYYTEKIVEAFACGCIPLTWCDSNVAHDFNPAALINLADYAAEGYAVGLQRELTPQRELELTQQPLLKSRPTLEPVRALLMQAVDSALHARRNSV